MNSDEISIAVEKKFPEFFQKSNTKFRDYLEFVSTYEATGYGSYFITKALPGEIRNYALSIFESMNTLQ